MQVRSGGITEDGAMITRGRHKRTWIEVIKKDMIVVN